MIGRVTQSGRYASDVATESSTDQLLEAWREATRASVLAERLARMASEAAATAEQDAATAQEVATLAEEAAAAAERAAAAARETARRAMDVAVRNRAESDQGAGAFAAAQDAEDASRDRFHVAERDASDH